MIVTVKPKHKRLNNPQSYTIREVYLIRAEAAQLHIHSDLRSEPFIIDTDYNEIYIQEEEVIK